MRREGRGRGEPRVAEDLADDFAALRVAREAEDERIFRFVTTVPDFRREIEYQNSSGRTFRQGLAPDGGIHVTSVLREHELIVIALRGENFRHGLVGDNPVVIAVLRDQEIAVADFHPEADRFHGAIGNQVLVEFPRAVWRLGARRPLLIHVRA